MLIVCWIGGGGEVSRPRSLNVLSLSEAVTYGLQYRVQ